MGEKKGARHLSVFGRLDVGSQDAPRARHARPTSNLAAHSPSFATHPARKQHKGPPHPRRPFASFNLSSLIPHLYILWNSSVIAAAPGAGVKSVSLMLLPSRLSAKVFSRRTVPWSSA